MVYSIFMSLSVVLVRYFDDIFAGYIFMGLVPLLWSDDVFSSGLHSLFRRGRMSGQDSLKLC